MEKSYLKKLSQLGYSIIPVDETKRPIGAWKKYQSEHRTQDEINKLNSPLYGLVCGYNGVEVIDVDLKVFDTPKERSDFWDEYLGFLNDNIDSFHEKFIIKKTKNNGYHIIYKCKSPTGNTKIAKLKDHNECVIESRGVGGMVVLYDGGDKNYHDMQMISDEDREILWSCSMVYNDHVEEIKPEKNKKKDTKDVEDGVLAFDDYNIKNDIFDVIGDDFKIVANLSRRYVIKRNGAESAHSGYVYKDSGCMYLFTTATIYPHQTLISPSAAYTYKYHNGDFKAASLDLYHKGYGTRTKKKIDDTAKDILPPEKIIEEYKIDTDSLEFPIDIFHPNLQTYLLECSTKLDSSVDYMGVSLLWTISLLVGNAINIEVKKGWIEPGIIWVAIVGKAGVGKTPSINNIIFPIEKINSREIKRYITDREEYDSYESLSKKEKEEVPEVKKPKKSQFIANDITIEALVDLHQESDNGVGVFKDELAGWIKDMNKYRDGSDLEFWLSTWSGKSVNVNRMTRAGSFVDKPFIPVMGGIQPDIFTAFYTDENKDSGFLDRLLLCYPEKTIEYYNEAEVPETLIQWYKDVIIYIFDSVKKNIKRDEEGDIVPALAVMTEDAKKEWIRIYNEITDLQNNDDESEYMKSVYPKQKSYIPRFALLINVFNSFFSDEKFALEIEKDSILHAEKLSKYFIANAKKIKIETNEKKDLIATIKPGKSKSEKIALIYQADPDFNRTQVAQMLEVSIRYVRKVVSEIESKIAENNKNRGEQK